MTRPRRVLWHSAPPWAPTSIGSQTALMARSLTRAGFDVHLSTYALDWGSTTWEGLPVLPSSVPALAMWADALLDPAAGDLVVTLTDAWRLYSEDVGGRPVLSWTPVEADPLDPDVAAHFRNTATTPLAVSDYGARLFADAGLAAVRAMPHGVDTDTFRPLVPGDRDASRRLARARLGIDPDRHVIGMVGTNGPAAMNRKSIPEVVAAVAGMTATAGRGITLYLHTRLDRAFGGFELSELVADHLGPAALGPAAGAPGAGPATDVRVTPVADYMRGLPADELNVLYNAFDTLCIPSAGEGFCLAMLEAQGCGVPVVASDFSAQPENLAIGRLVGGVRRPDPTNPASSFLTPSVAAITEALEELRRPVAADWQDGVAVAAERSHERRFRDLWLPLLDEFAAG